VLTDRSFGMSLVVTVLFIAMVVPVQTLVGLIAARAVLPRRSRPPTRQPSVSPRRA
jgi:ABC-type sugar transport system permease subunit